MVDAVAGEFVGDGVVLAVDVTENPMAAYGCEALRHVVAFREERAQVGAVAAPDAGHHHDDQRRVKFENKEAPWVAESASEVLTEAEEFGDVICARVGTKARGGGGGG